MEYKIIELNKTDASWYGNSKAKYLVRFKDGFAPKNKFANAKDGKFERENKETGYLEGNGSLGTGSLLLSKLSFLKTL